MQDDLTRISLLSRVRDASDQDAWAEFEVRYRDLILRYALARGLQYADAEDVRQIVMMSLASALRDFTYSRERGRFRDYLGRVVRNAIARLRARPNWRPADLAKYAEAMSGADSAAAADSVWEQEWVNHHYRLALRRLEDSFDPRSVEIFQQLVSGTTVAEAAAAFGMNQAAVHKIKQRARDRMRKFIVEQIRDEDEPDGSRAR